MESLIYHFKIVMGEVPVPVAEIYHPVRLKKYGCPSRFIPPSLLLQAIIKGSLLSDAIVILSSLKCNRWELDA
jgi:NADH-quinone oxidoreductase subunit D